MPELLAFQGAERLPSDPVQFLADAKRHVRRTCDLVHDPAAWDAYKILLHAQAQAKVRRQHPEFVEQAPETTAPPEPGCIDELLTDKLRAQGLSCPCPKHRKERVDKTIEHAKAVRNGKMAAAHDDVEE